MKRESKTPGKGGITRRMAIAAALFAACTALGSEPASAADEVAVWHFKITVNSSVSGDADTPSAPAISASVSAEASLNPLVLEFAT